MIRRSELGFALVRSSELGFESVRSSAASYKSVGSSEGYMNTDSDDDFEGTTDWRERASQGAIQEQRAREARQRRADTA